MIDRAGNPIASEADFYKLFSDERYQRLASDYSSDGEVQVSTVWTGMKYGNFETMLFSSDANVDQGRHTYLTEAEALAGHARLVHEYITRPALERSHVESDGGHQLLSGGAL